MKNQELVRNRVYSLALMGVASLMTAIDGDATAIVIVSLIAVPMFFAKENWILGGRYEDQENLRENLWGQHDRR